jgi:hypothetical protein
MLNPRLAGLKILRLDDHQPVLIQTNCISIPYMTMGVAQPPSRLCLCPQGRHLMPQRCLFVNMIFYFNFLARYFVRNAIPLRDPQHGYLKG